jgi:hypothetical protein
MKPRTAIAFAVGVYGTHLVQQHKDTVRRRARVVRAALLGRPVIANVKLGPIVVGDNEGMLIADSQFDGSLDRTPQRVRDAMHELADEFGERLAEVTRQSTVGVWLPPSEEG